MKKFPKWEILFENNQNPCLIAQKNSEEIIYFNSKFCDVFQIKEDIVGNNLFDILLAKTLKLEKPRYDWEKVELYETSCYHNGLDVNFLMRSTLLQEYDLVFTEFLPCDAVVLPSKKYEEAIARCLDIYTQQSGNVSFSLMEYLCEFYDSESAYIYRYDEKNESLFCIARWSEQTEKQAIDDVAAPLHGAALMKALIKENEAGILVLDEKKEGFNPESSLATLMKNIQVSNMSLCTVEDSSQKIVGMLGVSNRKNTKIPLEKRLLTAVSRFVSQEVTKGMVNQTLFHLQHRDPLTGLYNRNGYAKRVDAILSSSPTSLGVVVVNVNGLKFINDNAGISIGDEHIKKSAHRVKEYFGSDTFRMSGDEFIVILPNVAEDEFESKVMALRSEMKAEENYDFSFGHAWSGKGYELGKLQFEADTVMYINKQEYYSASKREFDMVKDTTLSDLLSYLKNDEFLVYLQPQVILEDGSLYGAEALIRRFDKTNQKMVFPDQFIPLYEQKSVIRHVDMFVVEEVCKLIHTWQKFGSAIPISVNLSRVTLLEYGIVDSIVEICDRYEIPHNLLVIEVTERVGLIENNVASSLIMDFKKRGFSISLDDFGCAYSNIVTLAQIEVNEVKLDKSLVDGILTNQKNQVIVESVLAMCNKLENTSTLAEGIEEESQGKILHDFGCHLGQGYYYSRPIPVEEFCDKYKILC